MAAVAQQHYFPGIATTDDPTRAQKNYVESTNNRRMAASTSLYPSTTCTDEIPIIDIGPAFSGSVAAQTAVAAEIKKAAEEIGFFMIKNHNVPLQVLDESFKQSKRFFDLPEEVKDTINSRDADGTFKYRGYLAKKSQARGDNHESFFAGTDVDKEINKAWYGPPKWPQEKDIPGFQAFFKYYLDTVGQLALKMNELFAEALNLPKDYFEPLTSDKDVILRLNHYLPQVMDENAAFGLRPHTDYAFYTILLQDSEPGLQVLNKQNEWILVKPTPGTFVINIADHLERISNDRFISTAHRAIPVTGLERNSVVYFSVLNLDAVIEVPDAVCTAENPRKYEPMSVEAIQTARIKLGY